MPDVVPQLKVAKAKEEAQQQAEPLCNRGGHWEGSRDRVQHPSDVKNTRGKEPAGAKRGATGQSQAGG